MLKHILLAGAVMISVPALAQDKTVPSDPARVAEQMLAQTAPATATPAPTPSVVTEAVSAQDSVAQTTPAPANPTAPADTQVAARPAQAAPAPANKAEEVAAVVGKEFPSYDKNGDGKLSDVEFSAWMVALKTASDPATKADSPATKTWLGQAFASADTDKNKSVSMTELNAFLAQG